MFCVSVLDKFLNIKEALNNKNKYYIKGYLQEFFLYILRECHQETWFPKSKSIRFIDKKKL